MTAMVRGLINDRWEIMLSEERASFHAERPLWEAGRLAHMAERVRPGMVVYDIGAEHGDLSALYGLWTRSLGGPAPVVLIEPEPRMWPSIRQTWEANMDGYGAPPRWFVGFASDETDLRPLGPGMARIGAQNDPLWPDAADGPLLHDPGFRHVRERAADTPRTRIDEFAFASSLPPDAIVMDIEGAEALALRGLERLSRRPLVWVSVHDVGEEFNALRDWYHSSAEELDALMRSFGYQDAVVLPANGEGERFFFWEGQP